MSVFGGLLAVMIVTIQEKTHKFVITVIDKAGLAADCAQSGDPDGRLAASTRGGCLQVTH